MTKRGTEKNTSAPSKREAHEKQFLAAVTRLAEPLCASEGMELIHVEYQREAGGRVLRLYIDKPGGVKLDDCVNVSRELSDILDARTDTEAPYRLEVSSPGIERPLGKLEDYRRFAGSKVKIRTRKAMEGRKNYTGVIKSVVDRNVHIDVDGCTVEIDYENISRARLVAEL